MTKLGETEKRPWSILDKPSRKESKLTRYVQELNAATAAMQSNVNKLSQRGENLDALQNKTDTLQGHAEGFKRGATRVRKRMWWSNMKWWMWCIFGVAILVLVIVLSGMLRCHPEC